MQNERQEMNRNVPEINVEQLRFILLQHAPDLQHLAVRNLPGRLPQSSETRSAAENASHGFPMTWTG